MNKRKKNPKRPMPPALKRYWQARNRRLKNPRRRRSKRWDRCVSKVKKAGTAVDPYAVCSSRIKNPRRRRRKNPTAHRVRLYAQRAGGKVLKYIGGFEFAEKGQPATFDNGRAAMTVGKKLRSRFPVLRRYRLWATSK